MSFRHCHWLIGWAAAAAALAAYGISALVLQHFPNSADEHAYRFQARVLAQGQVTVPAHPGQEFLNPFYILTHHGRVFSIFPPGWPLVLALGVRTGLEDWINPGLAAAAIVVLYRIGKLLCGPREAWLAVLFMGASTFFLWNSASYFSHPACLVGVLLTAWFLLQADRAGYPGWAVMAGAASSWTFSVRELTAVLLLLAPVLAAVYRSPRRMRFLGGFLLGALPGLLLYVGYNAELTGRWFYSARYLLESERLGFGERRITLFDYVEIQTYGAREAVNHLARNLGRLLLWTFPGLPLLAVLGAWQGRHDPWLPSFGAAVVLLILGYCLYPSEGGNQYGPRFYYESLGFLSLLGARGVAGILGGESRWRRVGWAGLCVAMGFSLIAGIIQSRFYYRQVYERRNLERLVAYHRLEQAVVFVGAPSGDMTQGDLIRNAPDPDSAAVIYAWDRGEKNDQLMKLMPERVFYLFRQDPGSGVFYLRQCASRLGE
ncbi:MAG TPA: hypothetical protein PKV38_10560 [bacterium]|nr:hypothetical protein [bacterium]